MRTVADYTLTTDADWYALPREGAEVPAWAAGIAAEAPADGPARDMLQSQVIAVSSAARDQFGDDVTVALWVPLPESGYVGALLAVTVWDLGVDGWTGPDAAAWPSGGADVLFEQRWAGRAPAGAYSARHTVGLAGDAGVSQEAAESVQCMVFPPDCAQFVQLAFVAESVSAFDDMPARVQPVVQSLQVRYDGGSW